MTDAPPQQRVRLRYNYTIITSVAFASDGWVRFEGSQEKMFFGENNFVVGEKVKITFERLPLDPTL